MTIDPLTIPCPFCEETITELSEDAVTCEVCDIDIPIDEWIHGGINALAGKLMKENFFVEPLPLSIKPKWVWCMDRRKYTHKQFNSFDEAVLDAWEYLERKKHEHRP